MERMFYFPLEDLSLPGEIVAPKLFFGNIHDIKDFIYKNKDNDNLSDFIQSMKNYLGGDKDATYTIAKKKEKLMNQVTIIDERIISKHQYQWVHMNIWGSPYDFYVDNIVANRLLVKDKNRYYVVIKPQFENIRIVGVKEEYDIYMKNQLWGIPELYQYERCKTEKSNDFNHILISRFYMIECMSCGKHTVQNVIKYFFNNHLNLKSCVDEIIGDNQIKQQ